MEIIGIWAQSLNNVIGQYVDGKYIIPWNFVKEDIEHFKKVTNNKVILMGYNTYKSIGHALPNRIANLVLTKSHYNELNVLFNEQGEPNDVNPVTSIEEAIRITEFLGQNELYIIGGKQLYEECLNRHLFTKIYRTIISKNLAIDSNTIVMPDIKKYYVMSWCKNYFNCNIETWDLK